MEKYSALPFNIRVDLEGLTRKELELAFEQGFEAIDCKNYLDGKNHIIIIYLQRDHEMLVLKQKITDDLLLTFQKEHMMQSTIRHIVALLDGGRTSGN